ncbi:hypothetical protein [Flavobacterium enshiense]|nr:hypothetical protein [Flavobacterium enshiense]UOK41620.1 hypothetical protein LZF87_09885 [Flavobacterium enshiense]
MKNSHFIIFIFFFISFFSYGQKKEITKGENIKNENYSFPKDFYFEINTGGNDSYNSQYNTFFRSYSDGDKMIKVESTNAEKERIYSFMKKIDFYKMPTKFEPKENIVTVSSNSFKRSIVIYSNGKKKFVSYDTGVTSESNKKKAKPFLDFYKMIWDIIYSKEEISKLPKSDYFYE